ncbi:NAD(P)-binding protein [Nostoc sp. 'Peltigera malacea cyanobiont' DB3992]|uniref:NAD(P)-binding protein n=1 Tax=Nostoc sp. 'Peltigera malacea cyanobiont' DB3992 TaxID=1206980 RepID=UPI00211E8096|nr:NAD(P)-binding protein [Nostoc sp. 'Peltigera malacea cyanobiont' DB3992]
MNTNLTQKLSKPIVEKVAIVGAGSGGLAAAIALRSQGIEVQVYEKAQEFHPAGTGLGLAPYGLHFLFCDACGGLRQRTGNCRNPQKFRMRSSPHSFKEYSGS